MLYNEIIGAGPSLVMLHGWGFSSGIFTSLVDKYKDQYQITLIDLPGHGYSDNVEGGIDEWCSEIINLIPKNSIILGWSLGGLIAIKIATRLKISKLILVASTPNFIHSDKWKYGIDIDNFINFSESIKINISKGLKRFISLQTNQKVQIKELNKLIDNFPTNPKSLNQGLKILLSTDLSRELKNLSIPVQAILGKNDALIPSKINDWYEHQKIPSTIINTGHLPFLHSDFKLSL
jgi:pimeloyl-[acyl-carrier protein] methyl ester esterase